MSSKPTPLLRVAIVEDHPAHAEWLQHLLRRLPGVGAIRLYASAEEALAGLLRTRADVVLMDVHLPGISGQECARRLKTLLPRLRVIMVTVHDEPDVLAEALKNGVAGYLTKPVRRHDLAAAFLKLRTGRFPLSDGMVDKLVEVARQPAVFMPHPRLTARENEILGRVVAGGTDKELAAHFQVAISTISRHLHNIYRKLRVHTRTEAVAKVCGLGG